MNLCKGTNKKKRKTQPPLTKAWDNEYKQEIKLHTHTVMQNYQLLDMRNPSISDPEINCQ